MQKLKEYTKHPGSFLVFILIILATVITVGTMVFLVAYILIRGIPNITPELFEWKYTSENVSMMPAIINTILMTGFTLLMAVPVGVFSAVYLAEYSKKGSKLVKLIRLTVETLAGIPSIVYGLFGFLAFVIALKWEYSFLAGAITLAIMVLPVIRRTTEEALWLYLIHTEKEASDLAPGKLRTIFRIVISECYAGYTFRSNTCHRTNSRRNRGTYLYCRNNGCRT